MDIHYYGDETDDRILDWKYEVANGDTKLGFIDWCIHNQEVEDDEETLDVVDR